MKRIRAKAEYSNEMINNMPDMAVKRIERDLTHRLGITILEEFKPTEHSRSFGYNTSYELDLAVGESKDFREVIKTLDAIIEVSKSLPIDSVYALALRAKMLLLKD